MVTLSNPKTRDIGRVVYDYDSALAFLRGKKERKLAHNTWVHKDTTRPEGGPIHVRLHRTNIVTYLPSGNIILDTGGYRSKTTKQRMNELLPANFGIYQKHGDWFLRDTAGGDEIIQSFDQQQMVLRTRPSQYAEGILRGLSRQMSKPDYPGHQPNPGRIVHRTAGVKVYWDSALKEYEVVGPDEKRGEGYFTADRKDAEDTAAMIAGKIAGAASTVRKVRVPYRGQIEVRGSGAATYWRDPSDTTSPFAGRWLLASPTFRADIEAAESEHQSNPRRQHPGYKGADIQFPEDRFSYRGYSVILGSDRETWYISKDGFHIGTATSAEQARGIIADLTADTYKGER